MLIQCRGIMITNRYLFLSTIDKCIKFKQYKEFSTNAQYHFYPIEYIEVSSMSNAAFTPQKCVIGGAYI